MNLQYPDDPRPKTGTDLTISAWVEVDETVQIAGFRECCDDVDQALRVLHELVLDVRDKAKRDWLLYQLHHIRQHVRVPVDELYATMLLRDN